MAALHRLSQQASLPARRARHRWTQMARDRRAVLSPDLADGNQRHRAQPGGGTRRAAARRRVSKAGWVGMPGWPTRQLSALVPTNRPAQHGSAPRVLTPTSHPAPSITGYRVAQRVPGSAARTVSVARSTTGSWVMTSWAKKISSGSVVYSRVRQPAAGDLLGEHGPFEQQRRQRVGGHGRDHKRQQVVPCVGQLQDDHDAGQRGAHDAADHRGQPAHRPEPVRARGSRWPSAAPSAAPIMNTGRARRRRCLPRSGS
jgi:hypothetical protein